MAGAGSRLVNIHHKLVNPLTLYQNFIGRLDDRFRLLFIKHSDFGVKTGGSFLYMNGRIDKNGMGFDTADGEILDSPKGLHTIERFLRNF